MYAKSFMHQSNLAGRLRLRGPTRPDKHGFWLNRLQVLQRRSRILRMAQLTSMLGPLRPIGALTSSS